MLLYVNNGVTTLTYATSNANNPPPQVSSYRVKFLKEDFLRLIKIAQPEFIFNVKNMYFFSFQGFVVYSLDCEQEDFNEIHIPILPAIEFSNSTWAKR